MKHIIFSVVLVITIVFSTKAQTFTNTSFAADGFPVTAGFSGKIEKTITPSANDTSLTAYSTYLGVTYVLTVSKVKDKDFAVRTVPGIVKRLEDKASKVDLKKSASLLNETTTYMNYKNDKGSFISIHVFNSDRYIFQVYSLNKKEYLSDSKNNKFFSTVTLSTHSTSQNNQVNTNGSNSKIETGTTSTNIVATSSVQSGTTGVWKLYDRGEIFDAKENKWFGCIVIKENTDGTYKIAYDGYGENYDEDVTADRIKAPTSNTTPAHVPYIRAIKGKTVTVKGNLRTGIIMEDLEWAELSSMACWPGIRNVEFEGKHVGYWFDLPKKSIVKITVTPASTKTRINLYGYSGFDLKKTPPEVSRCTTCEASHPTWIGQPNLNEPAQPQTIEFNATTRHNFVYIAVAGAKNVIEGDYTLTIDIL